MQHDRPESCLRADETGGLLSSVRKGLRGHETLVSLSLLIVPNVICWLLLFPGYFQADHQESIARFLSGAPSLWHSMVWSLLALPLVYATPSYALYGLFQIALFVVCAYCSIRRLVRLGILRGTVLTSALFGLFPSFLLFNELYSSDVCFASLLILLTSMCIEIAETRGGAFRDRGFCVRLALLCFFVLSLRKNAVLIGVTLCVVVPLAFRPVWRQALLTFLCSLVVALGLDMSWPVLMGAQPSPSQEMLSVPTLQIAATYAAGGDIPDDANRYLTSFRSSEDWAAAYVPYTADFAKNHISLTPEFAKSWLEIGLRNPGIYLSAYAQLEYPFWTLVDTSENFLSTDFGCNEQFTHEHLSPGHESYASQFGGEEEKSSLWRKPQSIQSLVNNLRLPVLSDLFYLVLFNRGLSLWVVLVGLVASARERRLGYLVSAIPVACVVLGLLVFAPMPLARYAMHTYYSLPLLIIYLVRRTSVRVVRQDSPEDC